MRGYARMKTLMPQQSHGEILRNIFGVDIMNFATHLTTINLAVRDLIDEENYPQIVRSDFFDVQTGRVFVTLPKQAKSPGLGKSQQREVELPSLDAVVGNPPTFVRKRFRKQRSPNTGDSFSRKRVSHYLGAATSIVIFGLMHQPFSNETVIYVC